MNTEGSAGRILAHDGNQRGAAILGDAVGGRGETHLVQGRREGPDRPGGAADNVGGHNLPVVGGIERQSAGVAGRLRQVGGDQRQGGRVCAEVNGVLCLTVSAIGCQPELSHCKIAGVAEVLSVPCRHAVNSEGSVVPVIKIEKTCEQRGLCKLQVVFHARL